MQLWILPYECPGLINYEFWSVFLRALCWAHTSYTSEEWMYIVRWYWIRACPMMCEWWCNSFFYRSEFLNKKIKRGQIDIIIKERREGGQKWRQSWQQKENDGALTTSQLLKVRGRVWTYEKRNGREPCAHQTSKVIRLIWPITWNNSSPCAAKQTPCTLESHSELTLTSVYSIYLHTMYMYYIVNQQKCQKWKVIHLILVQ